MSYCKRDGDHRSVFVAEEDLGKPEVVGSLVEEEEEDDEYGAILPNGEINWDCPCLGGMPHGPCGQEFRDAFSCFHYSTAEEKGSDCIGQFKAMQECFLKYPELYKDYEDEPEKNEGESGVKEGPENLSKQSQESSGGVGRDSVQLTSGSAAAS